MTDEEKLAKLDELEADSWKELEGYTSGGIHELNIIERCQRIREGLDYKQFAAAALAKAKASPPDLASPHRAWVPPYQRLSSGDEGF